MRSAVEQWPQKEADWKWFRPPTGLMSATLADTLAELGYSVAFGDVYSDWWIQDTAYHVNIVNGVTRDGSVIVLRAPDRSRGTRTLEILNQTRPLCRPVGSSLCDCRTCTASTTC